MEGGSNKDLTSTMGGLMSSTSSTNPENKEDDRENSNDSTPTSSTDASRTASKSQIVPEDPISSTSSDTPPESAITTSPAITSLSLGQSAAGSDGSSSGLSGGAPVSSKAAAAVPPSTPPSSSTLSSGRASGDTSTGTTNASTSIVSEKDMLDINITDTSPEKITENVDDIVQDLEILLGEPTTSFDYVPREGRRSGGGGGGKTSGLGGSSANQGSSVAAGAASAVAQTEREPTLGGDAESLDGSEFQQAPSEAEVSPQAKKETEAHQPAEPLKPAEDPPQDESPSNESQSVASPNHITKSDESETISEQTANQKSPDDGDTANETLAAEEANKSSEVASQEMIPGDAEVQQQSITSKDETSERTSDSEVLEKQKNEVTQDADNDGTTVGQQELSTEIAESQTNQTEDAEEIAQVQVPSEVARKSPALEAEIEDMAKTADPVLRGNLEHPSETETSKTEQIEPGPKSQHSKIEQESSVEEDNTEIPVLSEVHAEHNSESLVPSTGPNSEQQSSTYCEDTKEDNEDLGDKQSEQDIEVPMQVTGEPVGKSEEPMGASDEPMEVDQDDKTTSIKMDVDLQDNEVNEESPADASEMDVVEEIQPSERVSGQIQEPEVLEEQKSSTREPDREIVEEIASEVEELRNIEESSSGEQTREVTEETESASLQETKDDSQEAETMSPSEGVEPLPREAEDVLQQKTVTQRLPRESEDDLAEEETTIQEIAPSSQETEEDSQQRIVAQEVSHSPEESDHNPPNEEIPSQEIEASPQETQDDVQEERTASQDVNPSAEETESMREETADLEVAASAQETEDDSPKEETLSRAIAPSPQETEDDSPKEEMGSEEIALSTQKTEDDSPKEDTTSQEVAPSPEGTEDGSSKEETMCQETEDNSRKETISQEIVPSPQKTEDESSEEEEKEEPMIQEVESSARGTEDNSQKETTTQVEVPSPREIEDDSIQEVESSAQGTEGDPRKETITEQIAPSPQETGDDSSKEETVDQEVVPSSKETEVDSQKETITQEIIPSPQETGDDSPKETTTQDKISSPQPTEDDSSKDETVGQEVVPSPQETEDDTPKEETMSREVEPSPQETEDDSQKETATQEIVPSPRETEDDSPKEVESSPQMGEDSQTEETASREVAVFDATQTADSGTAQAQNEDDVDQSDRAEIVENTNLEVKEVANDTAKEKSEATPEITNPEEMETHIDAKESIVTRPEIPQQTEIIDDSNEDENLERPIESALDSRQTGEVLDGTEPVVKEDNTEKLDTSVSDQITKTAKQELDISEIVESETGEGKEVEAGQDTEIVPEIAEKLTSGEGKSEPQLEASVDDSQKCIEHLEPIQLEIPVQEGVDSEKDQVVEAEANKIVEPIPGTEGREMNESEEDVLAKEVEVAKEPQKQLESSQANDLAIDSSQSVQQIETQSNIQAESLEVANENLETKDEEPKLDAPVVDTSDTQIQSSSQLESSGDLIKPAEDSQSARLTEPSTEPAFVQEQQVSQEDSCELMETEGSPSSLTVEVSGKSLDGLTENVEALEISETVETMEVDENLETNQEWDKPEPTEKPKLNLIPYDSTSSESDKSGQEVEETEQVIPSEPVVESTPRRTSVGLSLPILDDDDSDEKRPSRVVAARKEPRVSHKVEITSPPKNLSQPAEIGPDRSQLETVANKAEVGTSSPVLEPAQSVSPIEPSRREDSSDFQKVAAVTAPETAKIEPSNALSLPILTESDDLESNVAVTEEVAAIQQEHTDSASEASTITNDQVEVHESRQLPDAQDSETVKPEASGIVTLPVVQIVAEDPTKLNLIQDAVEEESSKEVSGANPDLEPESNDFTQSTAIQTQDALQLNFDSTSLETDQTEAPDSDSNNAQLETLSDDLNTRVSDVLLSSHIEDDSDKITSDMLSSQIEETETIISHDQDLMTAEDDNDADDSVMSPHIQEEVTYGVMDEMPQDLDNLESLLAAAASDMMNNAQDIQDKHSADLMEANSSNLPEDDLGIDDILREKAADISPGQSQDTSGLVEEEDQRRQLTEVVLQVEPEVGPVENKQSVVSEVSQSGRELGVDDTNQAQEVAKREEAREVDQKLPLASDSIEHQKIPVERETELDEVPQKTTEAKSTDHENFAVEAAKSSAQTTDLQAAEKQNIVADVAQNEASAIDTGDTKPKSTDADLIDSQPVDTALPKKSPETNEINSTSQETVGKDLEVPITVQTESRNRETEHKEVRVPIAVRAESQRSPDSTKLKEPLLISILDDAADKDKCHSPKISIKPAKSSASSAEEPASTSSHDSSEDRENKGSLKMTITKQSDTMHSILKICSPGDNNSEAVPSQEHDSSEPTVPKLILKSSRVQSADKQHSPKITSSVAKQQQQQQSPDTTVLKVCTSPNEEKPDTCVDSSSSEPPTVPKLIIKPVVEQQHSPKMSTRSAKQQQVFSPQQRSSSPRITIKPIVKPEVAEAVSPLKITIKPVLKSDEAGHRQKHSPKLSIKPVVKHQSSADEDSCASEKVHSPRVTIKPIVKPEEETCVAGPRVTIKPIPKPQEEQLTVEHVHSPRITIKPIVRPSATTSNNESSLTSEVGSSSGITPRVTIKPIPKPTSADKPEKAGADVVEQQESQVVQEKGSPRITIKPIVKPIEIVEIPSDSDEEEEKIKERIVLKINKKGNNKESASTTSSSTGTVSGSSTSGSTHGRKREHPPDDEKSEKLAKIKFKFSKQGHPHIVQQQELTKQQHHQHEVAKQQHHNKRTSPDSERSSGNNKRFKADSDSLDAVSSHAHQAPINVLISAADSAPAQNISSSLSSSSSAGVPGDSIPKGNSTMMMMQDIVIISDDSSSQPGSTASGGGGGSSVSISDNRDPLDDLPVFEIGRKDERHQSLLSQAQAQSQSQVTSSSSSSGNSASLASSLSSNSATKKQESALPTGVSHVPVKKETSAATSTPPAAPRKRGRPRKVPLEVREEYKDVPPPAKEEEQHQQKPPSSPQHHHQQQQPSSSDLGSSSLSPGGGGGGGGALSPNSDSSALSPSLMNESSRPKRSCRGAQQSVRTTLGIKPRKPRGGGQGRGRGAKRGMGTRSSMSPPPPLVTAPPSPPPPPPAVAAAAAPQKEQQQHRGGKQDHHPTPRARRGGRGGASAAVHTASTSLPVVQLTDLVAQCEPHEEPLSKETFEKKDNTPVPEAEIVENSGETTEEKNFLGKVPSPAVTETAVPPKEPTSSGKNQRSAVPVEPESVASAVAGPSDEQPSPVAASASTLTADRADIVMYEEETRMSAERGSRGQTPAKQEDAVGGNSNQLPDVVKETPTQTLSLSESMRLPRMLTPPTALAALYSAATPPASSSGGVVISTPSPTKPVTCNLLTPSRGARRKWSLEDNLDIMRAYYLGTECDRNKQGYRKRSLQEWRKLRPDMPLQEHQLANQMYAIRTHNLLTEVQMADCKREVDQMLRGRRSPVLGGQNDDYEDESMLSTPKPGSPCNMSVDMMVSNVDIEESQSSVQSSATTESTKVRRSTVAAAAAPKSEPHQEPDVGMISADQLAEYYWNGGGPFMLQEQVAQFLGIKSFKRKYPNMARRAVDMQERDFIKESNLAAESMCDLGLTAVSSADVLDIMYSDFQEKYEEYCKHQRDRQALDLINKQKALTLAASQEKTKKDLMRQAVQSTASWNAGFNKTRRTQRKACMDLQTFTVHYPKGKLKQINKGKMGDYPVAVVPGQFTDHYKEFTPTEINNMPVNTMCYEPVERIPPPPPQDPDLDSQSDGSGSDSDSSSSQGSDSSYSGSSDENCTLCNKHQGAAAPKKSVPATTQ